MGCVRTCGVGSDLEISIVNELEDGAFARSSIYYSAWRPNFAGTQVCYAIHNKRLDAVVNVRESALRDPAAACDFYPTKPQIRSALRFLQILQPVSDTRSTPMLRRWRVP